MAVVKREAGAPAKEKKSRKETEDSTPSEKFKLNMELTEPSDRLEDYIILLTGEKKIGKTSLANMFGDASYFLAFEVGYRGLRLRQTSIGRTEWKSKAKQSVVAIRKAIAAGKSIGPIVVDTVDKAYEACEEYICDKLAIKHLADEEWGKGYTECKKEFDRWISDMSQLGVGLILISHSQEKEITTRDGTKYDRVMPTMSKQARQIIEPLVDVWTYYSYDGRDRVLVIEGDDHISAGHRLTERFRTPDGKPIRSISMGESAKEAYKNLVLAFNNEYDGPDGNESDEKPTKKLKKKSLKKLRLKG